MNHLELDRLLCERLNIPEARSVWRVVDDMHCHFTGTKEACDEFLRDWVLRNPTECVKASVEELMFYPALSTTGEGMVRLMDQLRYQNHEVVIEYLLEGLCYVRVGSANWKGCLPAPLSLALAAAAALGIEVPE